MALTGATVRAALAAVGAVGKQIRSFDELAAGANDALRQAPPGLTAAGAAAFLATLTQESAFLRATEEYGKSLRYDPWRGRTFEMLTWQPTYAAFGKWCAARDIILDPDQFVKNPKSLADYRFAWHGGVYFFAVNNLWRYANAGQFLQVSQGVNGGNGRIGTSFIPNGWAERQKMYRAYLTLGDALLPTGGPAPAAAPPSAPEPSRRPRGGHMSPMYTPEPASGQEKWDWPTVRIPISFDPPGGWGGRVLLKVDHGGRGGWIHMLRWWIRDKNWNPNAPLHFNRDVPVGASRGHAGSERFVGYGWQAEAPAGADMLEVVTSAPDGVVVREFYEK